MKTYYYRIYVNGTSSYGSVVVDVNATHNDIVCAILTDAVEEVTYSEQEID